MRVLCRHVLDDTRKRTPPFHLPAVPLHSSHLTQAHTLWFSSSLTPVIDLDSMFICDGAIRRTSARRIIRNCADQCPTTNPSAGPTLTALLTVCHGAQTRGILLHA